MNKKKNSKIVDFPSNNSESQRRVEAILFSAEEPLDLETRGEVFLSKKKFERLNERRMRSHKPLFVNFVAIFRNTITA